MAATNQIVTVYTKWPNLDISFRLEAVTKLNLLRKQPWAEWLFLHGSSLHLGKKNGEPKKQGKTKFKFKQNINDDCIEHINISVFKVMLNVTKNLMKRFNRFNTKKIQYKEQGFILMFLI